MTVNIGKHEFSIIWGGVYYFALYDYPSISDYELCRLLLFMRYEKANGRETKVVCDSPEVKARIEKALGSPNAYLRLSPPARLAGCGSCRDGCCLTEFICHTASCEDALSILSGKALLSAVKARGKSAFELASEPRNAAGDPEDFFDYVMFSWGNCCAGDRLVTERELKHPPTDAELANGFTPGVRFYYRYDTLARRQNAVFDGYHPIKLRDSLPLSEGLHAIIIPDIYKPRLAFAAEEYAGKTHFLPFRGDFRVWSQTVYGFVSSLQ